MQQASPLVDPPVSTRLALARRVRGRPDSPFEQRLIEVLKDDVFRAVRDLSPTEQCALSYERLRHLRRRMQLRAADLWGDPDKLIALHDRTAHVDGTLTTLLSIHYNLCIGSILQHGAGRPELSPYLAELERMDSIGVFLATELGYGNNVQALETEAVYDHSSRTFVLHTPSPMAVKFMPNTAAEGIPKIAVVMARLQVSGEPCGVYPFVVRLRTADGTCPGVRIVPLGDKPDYSLDNAMTSFDEVRVPFGNWLRGTESDIDGDGVFSSSIPSQGRRFLAAMNRVQTGKLCLSQSAVSMVRAALGIAIDYGGQRRTFGPGRASVSILAYRTYQRTIVEGMAVAYASAIFLEAIAGRHRRGEGGASVDRWLALGKVFSSSRGLAVLSRCRERLGAQGMFSANRIIPFWVCMNGIITAEGDNELLLMKTAREILMDVEYDHVFAVSPPGASLESREYLVWLVRERERLERERLVTSMHRGLSSMDTFELWNEHLDGAVQLADHHGMRLAVEAFARAVDEEREPGARRILDRLFRVFVLGEVSRFSTELVASGAFPLGAAAELRAEREGLVAELADQLALLSAALELDPELLQSPVLGDYVAAYTQAGAERVAPRSSYIRGIGAHPAADARDLGA